MSLGGHRGELKGAAQTARPVTGDVNISWPLPRDSDAYAGCQPWLESEPRQGPWVSVGRSGEQQRSSLAWRSQAGEDGPGLGEGQAVCRASEY